MNPIKYLCACLAVLVAISLLSLPDKPIRVAGDTTEATTTPQIVRVQPITPSPKSFELSRAQKAWLGALEWCESNGVEAAINPKDVDGTPSLGLLQFKPSTFRSFSKLYGIAATSTMNADIQEEIVTQMILRGGVNWRKQFPVCTSKLGLPPKNTH